MRETRDERGKRDDRDERGERRGGEESPATRGDFNALQAKFWPDSGST